MNYWVVLLILLAIAASIAAVVYWANHSRTPQADKLRDYLDQVREMNEENMRKWQDIWHNASAQKQNPPPTEHKGESHTDDDLDQETKDRIEREVRDKLEREAKEKLERERVEREVREKLEREAQEEKLEHEAREKLEREAQEKLELEERIEREEKDKLERERIEREEKDKLERERIEREEKDKLESGENVETSTEDESATRVRKRREIDNFAKKRKKSPTSDLWFNNNN